MACDACNPGRPGDLGGKCFRKHLKSVSGIPRSAGYNPCASSTFVVTNLLQSSRFVYEWVYCARGDIENRIKELLLKRPQSLPGLEPLVTPPTGSSAAH